MVTAQAFDIMVIIKMSRIWVICGPVLASVVKYSSCQLLAAVCTCLLICIFHIFLLYQFDTFVCLCTSKFCLIFKINVFWDMMSCSLVHRCQHFIMSFVDVHEDKDNKFLSTKLHDITYQKIIILKCTALKIPKSHVHLAS
jgi:hypothetical protein